MSSRNRINSVNVQQLLSQINDMASNNSSIYSKLNSYDHVIKKYKIDPLDSTALQIYQYLIEEQTLSSLPPGKSRVKMDSFKFSRNNIDLIQEQSQKNQVISDVQDPQIHNDKLFSFAKNHKNENRKVIKQQDLRPKQLFNQKQKSKSDNKHKNNPIFFIGDKNPSIFDDQKSKLSNDSKVKSVKTISHLSISESQSNLSSKNIIFNSQKTKQVPKIQQVTFKTILEDHLKYNYFQQFIKCVRKQKKQMNQMEIDKKIKFLYCMSLFKKGLRGLQQNVFNEKQNYRKAIQFQYNKSQSMLEEYFLQWKDFTQLSQQTKQRHQQIEQKLKKLSGYLFVNRLKDNMKSYQQFRQTKQTKHKQILQKQLLLKKTLFFKHFSNIFSTVKNQNNKIKEIQNIVKVKSYEKSIIYLKNNLIYQQNKQNQLIENCMMKVKGQRLIQNLKNQQNFIQVYWKSRNNAKKLIFLNYLLIVVKQNFQRLGYQYSWMNSVQQNINITDSKLSMVLSKYRQLKAFNRLKQYTKVQKQNKNKIKVMLMDRFLKYLAFSSYIQYRKKSQEHKIYKLQSLLFLNNGRRLINRLIKKQQKDLQNKQQKLRIYLYEQKCNEFFIYLQSYKNTKNYYNNVIEQLKQKRRNNLQNKIWISFKRVLKQQIINNKLVNQYIKLKNKLVEEKCFHILKNNIFQQKLFKKKQHNLHKLIKHRLFHYVSNKLIQNHKYSPKSKSIIHNKFNSLLIHKRKLQFISLWINTTKLQFLQQHIQSNLTQNYLSHLLIKSFKVLKFITLKTKQENLISIHIQQNHNFKLKSLYFQKLLETLIKRKSIKQINYLLNKLSQQIKYHQLKSAFKQIQQK